MKTAEELVAKIEQFLGLKLEKYRDKPTMKDYYIMSPTGKKIANITLIYSYEEWITGGHGTENWWIYLQGE